jgi:hypothetical protein
VACRRKRERPGRGHVGIDEGLVIKVGTLDEPHAGELGDLRPVTPLRRRQNDRDGLPVPERQFLDDP